MDAKETEELGSNEVASDGRGPAVILAGTFLSGVEVYGPFPTIDSAIAWWGETFHGKLGLNCTIALCQKSDTYPAYSPADALIAERDRLQAEVEKFKSDRPAWEKTREE